MPVSQHAHPKHRQPPPPPNQLGFAKRVTNGPEQLVSSASWPLTPASHVKPQNTRQAGVESASGSAACDTTPLPLSPPYSVTPTVSPAITEIYDLPSQAFSSENLEGHSSHPFPLHNIPPRFYFFLLPIWTKRGASSCSCRSDGQYFPSERACLLKQRFSTRLAPDALVLLSRAMFAIPGRAARLPSRVPCSLLLVCPLTVTCTLTTQEGQSSQASEIPGP